MRKHVSLIEKEGVCQNIRKNKEKINKFEFRVYTHWGRKAFATENEKMHHEKRGDYCS